jgi:hypothetical protein
MNRDPSVPLVASNVIVIYRGRTRKRKQLLTNNRGFIVVNDGPAFASQLTRCLTSVHLIRSQRMQESGLFVPNPDWVRGLAQLPWVPGDQDRITSRQYGR